MKSPDFSKLFISYGTGKSGSTLAFELVVAILVQNGIDQPKLEGSRCLKGKAINFASELCEESLMELASLTAGHHGPLAIKTHCRSTSGVRDCIKEHGILGHAVCRDPRDMALSMLDAAKHGQKWSGIGGRPFEKVEDTLPMIRFQVQNYMDWASCPSLMHLHYEQVAFNTAEVIERIAGQLNLSVESGKIIDWVINHRFTQRNKATSQRWKSEMSVEDADMMENEFSEFIQTYCSDVPDNPIMLRPKKWWRFW